MLTESKILSDEQIPYFRNQLSTTTLQTPRVDERSLEEPASPVRRAYRISESTAAKLDPSKFVASSSPSIESERLQEVDD